MLTSRPWQRSKAIPVATPNYCQGPQYGISFSRLCPLPRGVAQKAQRQREEGGKRANHAWRASETSTAARRIASAPRIAPIGTTSLASALGEKMPELQDEDDDEMDDLSGGVKLLNLRGGTDSAGLGVWEDEAERAMYESIPDLRERLPGACLTDAIPLEKGEIEDEDENKGETEGDKEEPEKIVPVFDLDEKVPVGQLVEARLQQLEGITNKESADSWAIDFGMHNSKVLGGGS